MINSFNPKLIDSRESFLQLSANANFFVSPALMTEPSKLGKGSFAQHSRLDNYKLLELIIIRQRSEKSYLENGFS